MATSASRSSSSRSSSTRSSRRKHRPILGLAVGTPGIVDRDGTIHWPLNLSLEDLQLGEILRTRYELPTIVANDSWAAAIATYLFRRDGRPANLVAITAGRGIGAGLVLNGELFDGDGRGAGEIGHVVVDPDGAACHCGRSGCLETIASEPAVLAAAAFAGVKVETLAELGALATRGRPCCPGRHRARRQGIGQRDRAPDRRARRPRQIVVHGSLTALGEPWLDAIRDEVASRSLGSSGHADPG